MIPPSAVEEQEKFMRSQLQLQQGEGSESEEEEDEEGKRDLWGAKKGQYYEEGEVISQARHS
jgi:hypothetical protein